MATMYARLINQYKFRFLILFSASSYKLIEKDQRSDEIELFANLKNNHNLTNTDINDFDANSQ